MCPTYQYHITHMKQESKQHYRYQMVLFAREFGNKPAAREYNTSVHTVRKWVRRYNKAGIKGLSDQARTPQFSPNKCTPTFEKKVIKLRTQTGNKFGAVRLKDRFDLKHGKSCIQRIIKQNKLTRKKKTGKTKRNELWAVKKLSKAFDKIQIDVKVLTDIPMYWRQTMKTSLPHYEFTARDVKTGATFICFARRNTSK